MQTPALQPTAQQADAPAELRNTPQPATPSTPVAEPALPTADAIAVATAPEPFAGAPTIVATPQQVITPSTAENPKPQPVPSAASCSLDMIEAEMRKQPQIDIPPRHHFAPGIYAREILIPAGTLLTGKIHKTEHLNIVSKGEIAVWTEEEGIRRVKAPFTFVAKPGTRRLGFAIEDTVWTTIHGTDETDLAKLEATLIETNNKLTGGSSCLG